MTPYEQLWLEFPLWCKWVKDPMLSPQWIGSLLWQGFYPWPTNFNMPWVWPKNLIFQCPARNSPFVRSDQQSKHHRMAVIIIIHLK